MTYACSDFTDDILDALELEVPEDAWDSPSDQADLALAEIQVLQRFEKAVRHALLVLNNEPGAWTLFEARIRAITKQADEERA